MSLSAALAVAVFAVESRLRFGAALGIPFALVVLLAYHSHSKRAIGIAAAVCSLLALGCLYLSPGQTLSAQFFADALLAVAAILSAAFVSLRLLSESCERERLARIVEFCGDAIIGKTLDGVVTSWNEGARSLYGYSAAEMIGQPVTRLAPPGGSNDIDQLLARVRNNESVKGHETVRIRKDGAHLHVSLTISPIRDAVGRPIAASTVARDISARKRLQEAHRQMSRELERRVQERTAELTRTGAALERSNRDLQEFAYVASHDLQTPLRAITGFAQALESDYQHVLDEQARDYIARIIRGATRLRELIQDLLEYSQVESRAAQFTAIDLNEVFQEAVDALQCRIEENGAEVTCGALPEVVGDGVQMAHLIQNLVENGISYRREDPPRVRVSAERDGPAWRISVADNGIGIASEHWERIFEIFRRLHSRQEYPGTGIGLALCRRIANRFGGRIWVESEVGRGSVFHFTIPDATAGRSNPAPLQVDMGDVAVQPVSAGGSK